MTRDRKPRTATERSRARNQRATRVLSPITLDAEHTRKLDAILARTSETTAAFVRRMIREQSSG
jgi:hypothetical protein